MLRAYLQEIGRIPLLTRDQEVVYGKQVQQMMQLQEHRKLLVLTLDQEPSLEVWAEQANLAPRTLSTVLRSGQQAKHTMLKANLRLVVSIAKKYQRCNLEFLDLIQEGNLGLERGIERFDPLQGYRLSTYVYWWIRQGITSAIATHSRTIRLPGHIHEKLAKIKQTQRQLLRDLGRNATSAEIATALSWTVSDVQNCLLVSRQPMSLDMRVGEAQDSKLADLLKDDGMTPEDYTVREALRQDIQQLLAELSPRQRQIVTLRYGLDGTQVRSLQEIGEQLGISRERVRQIEQKALNYLRHHRSRVREYLTV